MNDNIQSLDETSIEELSRAFSRLNLIDNALFMAVVDSRGGPEFCKIVIETVLGRKVRIERVYAERTIQGIDAGKHGIRMDALVFEIRETGTNPSKPKKAGSTTKLGVSQPGSTPKSGSAKPDGCLQKKTIYDIEPDKNEHYKKALPHRTRYYTSLSDAQALRSGASYDTLPDTVIIMILSYDPFGIGDMRYEGKTTLTTHPDYPYDDGIKRIYLYVDGKYNPKNANEKEVHELLQYMKETKAENAKSDTLATINQIVEAIQSLPPGALLSYYKQMEQEYMFNEQLREQRQELDEKSRELDEKSQELDEKNQELDEKNQELDEKNQELDRANKLIAAQKALIENLRRQH